MTNWISHYMSKVLFGIYYAFYIIAECVLGVSKSWDPIISISGMMALLIMLPISNAIQLLALCWLDIDIPTNSAILIDVILVFGMDWIIERYYPHVRKQIERNFQRDGWATKAAYGLLAVALICLSIYACSCLNDFYINANQRRYNIQ